MSKEKEKKSPQLPEIPKPTELVKPLADIAKPLADLERAAYETLIKGPAEALGLPPLPELPGPASVLSRVAAGKPPVEIPGVTETKEEKKSEEETPAAKEEKRKGSSKWGM